MLHGQSLNIAPTIQALMPALSDVTGKLVYKNRIESVTKTLVSDVKDKGVLAAVIGLGERFGSNNRQFVHGLGILR